MGYYFLLATCIRCGVAFTCNPKFVPTVRVKLGAPAEPLCYRCVEWRAQVRKEMGLPDDPPIHPQAYEPVDENAE